MGEPKKYVTLQDLLFLCLMLPVMVVLAVFFISLRVCEWLSLVKLWERK